MKSLMSLRHDWSMIDQSVSKIKIIGKKADKHDNPNVEECVSEETQNKTNQEMKSLEV